MVFKRDGIMETTYPMNVGFTELVQTSGLGRFLTFAILSPDRPLLGVQIGQLLRRGLSTTDSASVRRA